MKKNNNLIAAQALLMLCTFALPFISLYCQDAPRQIRRVSRSQGPRTTTPRSISRKRPVRTSAAPTTAEPEIEDAVEPAVQTPTTESTEENTEPTSHTQQTQAAAQPANTSTSWYNTLVPIFLATLYKGSTTGIKELTDAVVKLFIARREVLTKREELEKEKEQLNLLAYLSTDEGRQKLKTLPQEEQEVYKEWQTISSKDISKITTALSSKESKLAKIEKQTSIPAIVGTGAYIGLINTAVLVMGTLMGSAIGSALQMLMPADKP